MTQRQVRRQRGRVWTIVLALLCAFAVSVPALANSASGSVVVTGTIMPAIAPPQVGTGQLKLIDNTSLLIKPNKKEWYYVYTFVDALGNPVPVTIQSNGAWSGTLTAVQTSGDKKKMDLTGGLLHLSASSASAPMKLPKDFAEADADPALTASLDLGLIPGMPSDTFTIGTHSFYQYFLLHISEGSGSTTFSATLTYTITQTSGAAYTTSIPITLVFDPATCCKQ